MKKANYENIVKTVMKNKIGAPILQMAMVENGRMFATNLDIFVQVPTDLPDGIYEFAAKRWVKRDTMLREDYPVFPQVNMETSVLLPVKPLLDALHATTKDMTRPIFTNIFAGVNQYTETFDIVGTDGHRLYRRTMDVANNFQKDVDLLIPRDVLELIAKSKAEEVEYGYMGEWKDIEVCTNTDGEKRAVKQFNSTHGVIRFPGCTIIYRMEQGCFPNYDRVYPDKATYMVKVRTQDMLSVLKELQPIAKEGGGTVSLIMDDELFIGAKSTALEMEEAKRIPYTHGPGGMIDRDNVEVVMPVNAESNDRVFGFKDEPAGWIRIVANARYLIEALSVLGEDAYIYFDSALRPLIIAGENIITGPLPEPEVKEGE